jgi:hypothetical protein
MSDTPRTRHDGGIGADGQAVVNELLWLRED